MSASLTFIVFLLTTLLASVVIADDELKLPTPTTAVAAPGVEVEKSPEEKAVTKIDLLSSKEGGGGNEVGGGGNDPDAKFKARGFAIVTAMRDFNRMYVEFPEMQIPSDMIKTFEESVNNTQVHTWEARPMLHGKEPRDAGVFINPQDGNRWSIALYRQTFEDYNKNHVNYDEIVLHEYGLAANLPDQFHVVTAPVIAKLKAAGMIDPSASRSSRLGRGLANEEAGIPSGLTSRPATRIFFKSQGEAPPDAMATFLGSKDSFVLNKILGPETLVVSIPRTVDGKTGVTLVDVPAEDFLEYQSILKNTFVSGDAKGRPRFGLSCGVVAEGTPSCVIWTWLWPDESKKGSTLSSLVEYTVNGVKKKYHRLEIQDPADARMLFRRMQVPDEMGESQAPEQKDADRSAPSRPPLNFLRRAFYASDESFSIDCFQFYGAISSFSCTVETLLAKANQISAEQNEGLMRLADQTFAYHDAKAKEILGARAVVTRLVDTKIEQAASDRQKLRADVMRAALSGYYRNRGYSPTARGNGSQAALLNAMHPDDLLIIAEHVRRSLR